MPLSTFRRLLPLVAIAFVFPVWTCQWSWAQQSATQAQQATPAIPQPEVLASLIRWTLIAVSQANGTGNYTVLRELGSPEFQAANSAAKLGAVFASIREQRLNLAFVTIATPQLSQPPTIDAKGILRLIGFYPSRPLQINFDLSFQPVDGAWRHSNIALGAVQPAAASPPAPEKEHESKKRLKTPQGNAK